MAAIPTSSMDTETLTLFRGQLQGRMEGLRLDRRSWWAHWADLARVYLPRRYRWFVSTNQMNRGSAKNKDIVDETGMLAMRTCAAGMLAGMASPLRPWFHLRLASPNAPMSKPVAVWLDQVEQQLYRVFDESGFYDAMGVLYHDLVVFGSAAMLISEDYENVISCYNPYLGEFFFANDSKNRVDSFYREFTMTVSQMVDKFGLENVCEPTRVAYRAGGAQRTTERVICHAIEPNTELYKDATTTQMKVVPGKFKFREVYWEQASPTPTFLRVSGIEEQNFIGSRWSTTGNDAYGSGPGMDGFPAVSQLQLEQRRKAEGIDKWVRPPMIADVSMKNEPSSTIPGAITYVTNPNSNVGFKPAFEVRPELQWMIEDIKEVQQRVGRIGYNDLFMMISNLDTVRTATEIDARREEKLILLGPVVERNQTEVLDVAIDRTFAIMQRHPGVLPVPPSEIAGQPLKIEYVSMLAEAQRAASTSTIERLLSLAGNLAGVRPDVLDNLDWDAAIRDYGDRLNVSPIIMSDPREMMAVRQARAQKEQSAEALQVGMAGVQGAALLAKAGLMPGQQQTFGGVPQ